MAAYLERLFKGIRSPQHQHDESKESKESSDSTAVYRLGDGGDDSHHHHHTPLSPTREGVARDKISEMTNFLLPENKDHRWSCQKELSVCLPTPSVTPPSSAESSPSEILVGYATSTYIRPGGWAKRTNYSMMPTSITLGGEGTSSSVIPYSESDSSPGSIGWNRCQATCGSSYSSRHKWEQTILLSKMHRDFLITLLRRMLTIVLPHAAVVLPTKAGDLAMAIRIIFSLSYSATPWSFTLGEGTMERMEILIAAFNLHWPPLYEIIVSLGIGKDEIYLAIGSELDHVILQVKSTQVDLDRNLEVDTLNFRTLDRMKLLKEAIIASLKTYGKLLEVTTILGEGPYLETIEIRKSSPRASRHSHYDSSRPSRPTVLYEAMPTTKIRRKFLVNLITEELSDLSTPIRLLCRDLMTHSSRVTRSMKYDDDDNERSSRQSYSLDTWILNGKGGMEIESVDPTAIDIGINIRRLSREICDLFTAFTSKLMMYS
jgi:hypothetical protein